MIYSLYRHLSPYIKVLTKNLGLSSGHCRFTPTCSLYTEQAIKKYGILLGSWYAVVRLLQCHPWSKGGYDPIP